MMVDMRYHIVSLVAVFLALGIGILIGAAVLGNDTLVEEQKAMIDRLVADFDRLRTEQTQLENNLKEQRAALDANLMFGREVLPILVKDLLPGRRIAVIRTGDALSDKMYKEIASTLRLAGAKVTSVTTFLRNVDFADPVFKQQTLEVLGLAADFRKDLSQELFGRLAAEIVGGQGLIAMGFLQDSAVIQTTGDYSGAIDAVLIIGGVHDSLRSTCRLIDLPMINTFKAKNITVIASEPFVAETSYIKDYRQKSVTTIDNIDTIPGQVALIYSLAWNKKGNYGIKEGARSILPEL